MRIAKLSVGIDNSGIRYNRSDELKTAITRGAELENGHVVRGLGTSYESKEAEARHKYRTQLAVQIRAAFAGRFLRGPLFESAFVVSRKGEAREWVDGLVLEFKTGTKKDGTFKQETLKVMDIPGVTVYVQECDLSSEDELEAEQVREWIQAIKDQMLRVKTGRGGEISDEGLKTIESLARCPLIVQESRDSILALVNQARVGKADRTELKRGISLLDVKIDTTAMLAPRSRPTLEPAAQ